MTETKKGSVLIVDDENFNITVLTKILDSEYTVLSATNGKDAIETAKKRLPGVIILDVVMPEMDGYAVIAELKKSDITKNIPVIFVTKLSGADNEKKGFDLGAADYISKPFSTAIVKLRVQNQIQIVNQIRAITEANRAKSYFLSAMSHEMRTPMNAIIGMTYIGKNKTSMEEKNQALNKIGDASSHLLGVINSILDMAKIEADKLELSPVEYNFDRLLQKTAAVINFRMDEKQQDFSVNIDNNIPHFIIGDDQRLAQVITNLLSNAVKFTPIDGKIQLAAYLIGEVDNTCELRIEVADSGVGISPEKQNRLFQAFEQAESGTSREYGGTGLGLAISKRIVELMGGRIWIESESGKGAKFIFTVKALRGEKDFRSLLAPGVNWENIQTIAVGDNSEACKIVQSIFNQLNIKCDAAANGLEALRLIEERGGYDIYFIDWRMPGIDGIELAKQINSRKNKNQPVVTMITSMDREQIKNEAGVDRYMIKPIFPSMLIDVINECIGLACSQHESTEGKKGEFADKKMLLVEDIEINREILIELLANTEIDIECAENGKDALKMVEAEPGKYDIVFMDIHMPKMDGFETTRHIRALEAELLDKTGTRTYPCGRMPIVAMTANVFKNDIEECLAAGMDDHLGKPVDIDKTLEILRKYMSLYQNLV